jgi:hypothetical protein
LQQWLILLLALDVADESRSVLLDGFSDDELDWLLARCGLLGSSSFQLGEESRVCGLGRGVEVDGRERVGSGLGGGLNGSHCDER